MTSTSQTNSKRFIYKGLSLLALLTAISGLLFHPSIDVVTALELTEVTPLSLALNEDTCLAAVERAPRCTEIEQKILASTLRIEIKTWIMYVEEVGYISYHSDGHATVKDGRYLLTHNHFQLPLIEVLANEEARKLATVTLYRADGQQLWQGPLTKMEIAFEDSETLLLEFEDENGQGLFESLNIPSADFSILSQLSAGLGSEVAQVNWDAKQAFVQWTHIKEMAEKDNTQIIRLADCILLGASGGGIFVDGIHIANNWSRQNICDEPLVEATPYHSTSALNTAELLNISQ